MEEIRRSWEKDYFIQEIIQDLGRSTNSHPSYTWVNGHFNKKGKVVVGD